MRRLLFIATALALVTALLAACGSDDSFIEPASKGTTHSTAANSADHAARSVRIAARSFEYDPAEIRAKAGENLAIVLTSEDVLHDFVIDELNVYIAADVGMTKVKGMRAGKAGRYTFYCSLPGHLQAGMEGTLIVE